MGVPGFKKITLQAILKASLFRGGLWFSEDIRNSQEAEVTTTLCAGIGSGMSVMASTPRKAPRQRPRHDASSRRRLWHAESNVQPPLTP